MWLALTALVLAAAIGFTSSYQHLSAISLKNVVIEHGTIETILCSDPWESGTLSPKTPRKPLLGATTHDIDRVSGTKQNVERLADGRRGISIMPSAEYFRRQSNVCLRLSLISSSEEVANRLIVMAQDYQAKAEAIEAESRWPESLRRMEPNSPERRGNSA
jgi:hypothetical protein